MLILISISLEDKFINREIFDDSGSNCGNDDLFVNDDTIEIEGASLFFQRVIVLGRSFQAGSRESGGSSGANPKDDVLKENQFTRIVRAE